MLAPVMRTVLFFLFWLLPLLFSAAACALTTGGGEARLGSIFVGRRRVFFFLSVFDASDLRSLFVFYSSVSLSRLSHLPLLLTARHL